MEIFNENYTLTEKKKKKKKIAKMFRSCCMNQNDEEKEEIQKPETKKEPLEASTWPKRYFCERCEYMVETVVRFDCGAYCPDCICAIIKKDCFLYKKNCVFCQRNHIPIGEQID